MLTCRVWKFHAQPWVSLRKEYNRKNGLKWRFRVMSNRRRFLKRGIGVVLGSILSFLVLPKLGTSISTDVSAMGDKQLRLLQATMGLLQKAGMLRAQSVFHYSPDSEIEMDWSVAIPPEVEISPQTDNLAQQILALINQ